MVLAQRVLTSAAALAAAWALGGGLSCQSDRSGGSSRASATRPASQEGASGTVASAPSASQPTSVSQPGGLTEAVGKGALDWFDNSIASGVVEKMVPLAEKVADRFIAGGNLFVAGNPGFCDEMVGRAGGFPFTRHVYSAVPDANDVVLVGLYRTDGADCDFDIFDAELRRQMFGKALVIHLAGHDWAHLKSAVARAATRPADESLALLNTGAPRGDTWQGQCLGQLATTALAWALHGEILSAATRRGKTLATFASDWEPGGPDWDDTVRYEHLHPTYRLPAIPAGKIGNEYLRACRGQVADFIATQAGQVRLAAAKMAQSMKRGGTVWIITNSHIHGRGSLIPQQLSSMNMCGREGAWHGTISGMQPPDVLLWLGYLRYPSDEMNEAVARGGAVVLCADDGPKDSRRVNIRACWKDFDTVINLPKYPIRVLPSTGTVACAQWYCIMAETAALMKSKSTR